MKFFIIVILSIIASTQILASQRQKSALVIGAGPAGIINALMLQKEGLKVTLIEKRKIESSFQNEIARNRIVFLNDSSDHYLKRKLGAKYKTYDLKKIKFTLYKETYNSSVFPVEKMDFWRPYFDTVMNRPTGSFVNLGEFEKDLRTFFVKNGGTLIQDVNPISLKITPNTVQFTGSKVGSLMRSTHYLNPELVIHADAIESSTLKNIIPNLPMNKNIDLKNPIPNFMVIDFKLNSQAKGKSQNTIHYLATQTNIIGALFTTQQDGMAHISLGSNRRVIYESGSPRYIKDGEKTFDLYQILKLDPQEIATLKVSSYENIVTTMEKTYYRRHGRLYIPIGDLLGRVPPVTGQGVNKAIDMIFKQQQYLLPALKTDLPMESFLMRYQSAIKRSVQYNVKFSQYFANLVRTYSKNARSAGLLFYLLTFTPPELAEKILKGVVENKGPIRALNLILKSAFGRPIPPHDCLENFL